MQLTRLALGLVVLAALATSAHADGELQLRTVYFKEKATRVIPPMLDARFDAGETGTIDAHFLVDAITSASAASGADGASFSEKRVELGAGYQRVLGRYTVAGSARYSSEPDYDAAFGKVRGQVELLQRNLTIGVAAGFGSDRVTNAGAPPMAPRFEGTLTTYLASLSVSQILSRNAIGSVTYDLIYLDGFQQNPYRAVAAGGTLVGERHPEQRLRHAVAAQTRYFVERTGTTLIGSYRFYTDDWGLRAHTPELRVIQDAGETMQLGLRYRYHRQGAADFYQDRYLTADPAMEPFLSDDEKLSQFDNHSVAMKFVVTGATFGFEDQLEQVQGELIIEYNVQHNAFGNAGIAHAALTIPFEY